MTIPKQLQSRKFWLAAIGVLAGLGLGVYGVITNKPDVTNQAVTLIMVSVGGYIAAEGTADVVERSKNADTAKLVTLAKLDGELAETSSNTAEDREITHG